MTERKTLKSVSIDDVKPRVTLTPIVEVFGETCRIHHIKADSIAVDGRDTFVPLRHVSKRRRRIFELESEIEPLRLWLTDIKEVETCRNVSDVDGIFICSECKCQIEGMVVLNGTRRWVVPPYCPNCGRRVVE